MANTRPAGVMISFTPEELEVIEDYDLTPSRVAKQVIRELGAATGMCPFDMKVVPVMYAHLDDMEDGVAVTCVAPGCLEARRADCALDKLGALVTEKIVDMAAGSGLNSVA